MLVITKTDPSSSIYCEKVLHVFWLPFCCEGFAKGKIIHFQILSVQKQSAWVKSQSERSAEYERLGAIQFSAKNENKKSYHVDLEFEKQILKTKKDDRKSTSQTFSDFQKKLVLLQKTKR